MKARAREDALDTFERLKELFTDVVTDEAELNRETTAKDVPEWDSLSHVRLILAVERGFKVKFTAAEIARLKKFGDLVDLVQTKSAK